MARARWKFLYYENAIWKHTFSKFYSEKLKLKKKLIITNKSSSIPPIYLYKNVSLHKGNIFLKKKVNRHMIGFKFGEFAFSRKPFFFPLKKKNKKKIKR